MKTAYIGLAVHYLPADMPDADTDVLIFDASSDEAQLGAYVGEEASPTGWVDAQGAPVDSVVAWCAMPRLRGPAWRPDAPAEASALWTTDGKEIHLGAPWKVPA